MIYNLLGKSNHFTILNYAITSCIRIYHLNYLTILIRKQNHFSLILEKSFIYFKYWWYILLNWMVDYHKIDWFTVKNGKWSYLIISPPFFFGQMCSWISTLIKQVNSVCMRKKAQNIFIIFSTRLSRLQTKKQ
jgi:hypothetical protein